MQEALLAAGASAHKSSSLPISHSSAAVLGGAGLYFPFQYLPAGPAKYLGGPWCFLSEMEMEPPPWVPGVSLWGSAPPSGGQHPGGGGGSALIPGHLLCLEAPSASQVCGGKVAVRFPGRPAWVWGAGRSLWRVAGRARSQRGGHRELTNWASPRKFGRGPPAHGLSSSKIHPWAEQAHFSPKLVETRD